MTETYKALGMMRGKSLSVEWETADATADKSTEHAKNRTGNTSPFPSQVTAYPLQEALHNQKELKRHVINR